MGRESAGEAMRAEAAKWKAPGGRKEPEEIIELDESDLMGEEHELTEEDVAKVRASLAADQKTESEIELGEEDVEELPEIELDLADLEEITPDEEVVYSDIIRPQDIDRWADKIVKEIEESQADGKPPFQNLLDVLNETNILKEFEAGYGKKGGLKKSEIINALVPIRKALIEKVKSRIEGRFYFSKKEMGKSKKEGGPEPVRVKEVVDQYGQAHILKEGTKMPNLHEVQKALSIFKKLKKHPNIVSIKEFNETGGAVLFDKLEMDVLESLTPDKNKKEAVGLAETLKIVSDCAEGAHYLEQNGLVLQDISLLNFGILKEGGQKRGILFDLEGLCRDGALVGSRLYLHRNFTEEQKKEEQTTNPEEKKRKLLEEVARQPYLPPEFLDRKNKGAIHAKEMVFQFGRSLQELLPLLELFPDVKSSNSMDRIAIGADLRRLIDNATEKDPQERISLEELKQGLAEIIGAIKEAGMQAEQPAPEEKRLAA